MKIPGEREWLNEHNDLDVACAKKNFFGVNHEQALHLFELNALHYQEDVVFMPFECFAYYIHAYLDYLLSEASKGDSDGASCFFGMVECRATDIQRLPQETRLKIERTLKRLAAGQEFYDADETIYGNFAERMRALEFSAVRDG